MTHSECVQMFGKYFTEIQECWVKPAFSYRTCNYFCWYIVLVCILLVACQAHVTQPQVLTCKYSRHLKPTIGKLNPANKWPSYPRSLAMSAQAAMLWILTVCGWLIPTISKGHRVPWILHRSDLHLLGGEQQPQIANQHLQLESREPRGSFATYRKNGYECHRNLTFNFLKSWFLTCIQNECNSTSHF